MSKARPFTEAHALATVDVGLIFDKKLSGSTRESIASALKRHFKGELKQVRQKSAANKIIIFRRKVDDDVAEEVHIHDGYVHAIFFEYRGWSITRDQMVNRLSPILKMAQDSSAVLKSAGLVFRDVFFTDNPSDFSASEIFALESRWLPQFAFSAGNNWQGTFDWTDTTQPGLKIRSKLSVRASMESTHSSQHQAHVTEVVHQQEIFGNDPAENMVEWSDDRLKKKLDHSHNLNKQLLLNLLSVEMSRRIGLKETS